MKLTRNILNKVITEAMTNMAQEDFNPSNESDGVAMANKEIEENPLNDPINHNFESKKYNIKLTEDILNTIIYESVNRILKEEEGVYRGNKEIEQHQKDKEIKGAWKIRDKKKQDKYYSDLDKLNAKENKNIRDTKGKAAMKQLKKKG